MCVFFISIHAPTRGATGARYVPKFFNGISIHAPTRGATDNRTGDIKCLKISIHAPTRGATSHTTLSVVGILDFNPRSHEGSDPFQYDPAVAENISIHAPTRGATDIKCLKEIPAGISIHAPTRGATIHFFTSFLPQLFQSTLPRGERLKSTTHYREGEHFNPRSHEGSDVSNVYTIPSEFLFQSTLPRGERRIYYHLGKRLH